MTLVKRGINHAAVNHRVLWQSNLFRSWTRTKANVHSSPSNTGKMQICFDRQRKRRLHLLYPQYIPSLPLGVSPVLEDETVRLRSAEGLLGDGPAPRFAIPVTVTGFSGSGSRGKSGKNGMVTWWRSLEPLVSPGSGSSPLYISYPELIEFSLSV